MEMLLKVTLKMIIVKMEPIHLKAGVFIEES